MGDYPVLDFSPLALKPDHARRPFWVAPTGSIFLEGADAPAFALGSCSSRHPSAASSPLYEQARDFLVAICEPVSRPDFIHEYRLDKNALFAAASMGMTAPHILSALSKMSKVPVSARVEDFVRTCTAGGSLFRFRSREHELRDSPFRMMQATAR